MLVSPVLAPFTDAGWLWEPKMDGIRCLAYVSEGTATLVSRRQRNMTDQYPELVGLPDRVAASSAVLDGELVVLGPDGTPDFALLMRRVRLVRADAIRRAMVDTPVVYVVFDLLHLDGDDLRGQELAERKRLLAATVQPSASVCVADYILGEGELLYQAVVERGLEGVVAKKLDSRYWPGKRSKRWVKAKIPGWHREFGFQQR